MEDTDTNKTQKYTRIVGGIVSLFAIITLGYVKNSNPDFPLLAIVLISLGIFCLFLVFFFWSYLFSIFSNEKKKSTVDGLPEPITIEQANEIIEKIFLSPTYADHVNGWKYHKIYTVGKIKKCKILLVRLEKTTYCTTDNLYVIINMHYPGWYTILSNPNIPEIHRCINSLAVDPDDEPNKEIIEEENPLLGTKRVITRTNKPEQKKDDEKKEELK